MSDLDSALSWRPASRKFRLVAGVLLAVSAAYGIIYLLFCAAKGWPGGFGDSIALWSWGHFLRDHQAATIYDPSAPRAGRGTVMVVRGIMAFLRGGGIAGPALFAALQLLVGLSGALPASLLGIAAGAIYGLAPGFSLVATGTLFGAMIAFALSRSLFRPSVERALARHRRLYSLDALVARDGWKLVLLLRLLPIMPFSATSYVLGLSSVSLQDYLIGTLASLPALLGYVYLGTLTDAGVSAWTAGDSVLRWILPGVGAAATLLLMAHLGRLVAQRHVGTELIDRENAPAE